MTPIEQAIQFLEKTEKELSKISKSSKNFTKFSDIEKANQNLQDLKNLEKNIECVGEVKSVDQIFKKEIIKLQNYEKRALNLKNMFLQTQQQIEQKLVSFFVFFLTVFEN